MLIRSVFRLFLPRIGLLSDAIDVVRLREKASSYSSIGFLFGSSFNPAAYDCGCILSSFSFWVSKLILDHFRGQECVLR